MKQSYEQAFAVAKTETLWKVWKNRNFRTLHIKSVNGGHNEKHNMKVKLVEYLHYDTYGAP